MLSSAKEERKKKEEKRNVHTIVPLVHSRGAISHAQLLRVEGTASQIFRKKSTHANMYNDDDIFPLP